MRFYETEQEFILLKDGEEAPSNYATFKLNMTLNGSDNVFLPNYNLVIKHWTSEYPTQMHTAFVYKGFEYRPKHNDFSQAELLVFLNDLKAGDATKKITEQIVNSLKNEGLYSLNRTIENIEKLRTENEKLKAKIESIKEIVSHNEQL